LADRRSLLQRFRKVSRALAKVVGALAQCVEQSDVLDCDGRLVSKSGGQLYLLFSKWTHLIPGEREDADRRSLAQHRNPQNSTISVESLRKGVFAIGLDVGNMNHLSFEQDPSVN